MKKISKIAVKFIRHLILHRFILYKKIPLKSEEGRIRKLVSLWNKVPNVHWDYDSFIHFGFFLRENKCLAVRRKLIRNIVQTGAVSTIYITIYTYLTKNRCLTVRLRLVPKEINCTRLVHKFNGVWSRTL